MDRWTLIAAATALGLGSLGLLWSDWMLLAGATSAAALTAWRITRPDKPMT